VTQPDPAVELIGRTFAEWQMSLGDPSATPFADTLLAALREAGWRSSDHRFDEESVLNPATGKPYGPGPLWAGTEPMDYPDPHCVCGAPWVDDECSRVGELHRTRAERDDYRARLKATDAAWARIAAERDVLVNLRDAARGLEVVLGAAAGRVNLADIEHQLSALLAALPPREEPRPAVVSAPLVSAVEPITPHGCDRDHHRIADPGTAHGEALMDDVYRDWPGEPGEEPRTDG
jgi:hypothetical protein